MDLVHQSESKLLEKGVAATGFVMSILCIAAGIQFYFSMGSNGFESTVYVGVGVCIALVTILLLPITVISWQHHKVFRAVIAGFLWLLLLSLQIFAEFGFFAASQDHLESANNVNSIGYTAAKARFEDATRKLGTMSGNASVDVAGLSSKLDSLNAQKAAAAAKLSQCKKDWFTNCKNPLSAEVAGLNEQISKIENQLGGSRGYQGIVAEREAALKDLQSVAQTSGVATSNVAPVWLYGEKLLKIPARTIQVYMIIFISIMMELWGSYSAYILMVGIGAYKRDDVQQQLSTVPDIKNITPEPEKLAAAPQPKIEPQKFTIAPPVQVVTWSDTQPVKKG